MRSLSMILMVSLGVLFSDASLVQAHNDTFFNSPHNLELKPANSEPAYRLAKSYWLGGADIGLSFEGDDGSTVCRAQGYTSDSCIPPLSIIKTCSYNGNYHLCGCDSSVYKYSSQDCPADAEPDGSDTCDGYSRACVCTEKGYVWQENGNYCEFSCTSNSDCAGGVCDISEGQCYECLQPSDCGVGYECINRECEEAKLCDGVTCASGQSCNENTGECECLSGFTDGDQCVECRNNADCDGFCSSGKCVQCLKDSDCGSGNWSCSQGQCRMEEDPCNTVLCEGGTCTDGICTCPTGKENINGVCKCKSGTIEVGGACEAPNCANGGDPCPDGQTCNTATKLCENTARIVPCKVGDTLYSDIHCYEGVPVDKKAIAVVFDTTENLAVSLEEQEKTWGSDDIDIPSLGNCLRSTIDSCRPASGKESTANILSYGRMYNISYPAAEYCNNYSTQGTTTGDWWLPSGSELMRMRTNYEIINETLTKLNAAITVWYDYWSSSEQARRSAISIHIGSTAVASNSKIFENYVRCVLAY